MAIRDYKDINIRYAGHPKYISSRVVEDRIMEVILQKLEMILFTKKGDIIGQPDLGCNIEYYLWSTTVPSDKIKKIIQEQIIDYIPELLNMTYSVETDLYQGTIRDILYINIVIQDVNVNFIFQ